MNDDHNIAYIRIAHVQRSLLMVGLGRHPDRIKASTPQNVPDISFNDDFVINGAEIENIALSYVRPNISLENSNNRRKWAYLAALVLPALMSLSAYAHVLLTLSNAPTPDDPKFFEQAIRQQIAFDRSQIQFNGLILKGFDAISGGLKDHATPSNPQPNLTQTVFPIFFDTGVHELSPSNQQIVSQAVNAYNKGSFSVIEVSGYADANGTPGENRKVSEQRAREVAEQLAADGVPIPNILIHAYGSASVDLKTEATHDPENRRVEIIMH